AHGRNHPGGRPSGVSTREAARQYRLCHDMAKGNGPVLRRGYTPRIGEPPVGAVYGAVKKLPSQLVKCRMSVVRCLMRLRAIALALRGPPLQIFLLYSRRGGLNVEDQAVCSVD